MTINAGDLITVYGSALFPIPAGVAPNDEVDLVVTAFSGGMATGQLSVFRHNGATMPLPGAFVSVHESSVIRVTPPSTGVPAPTGPAVGQLVKLKQHPGNNQFIHAVVVDNADPATLKVQLSTVEDPPYSVMPCPGIIAVVDRSYVAP